MQHIFILILLIAVIFGLIRRYSTNDMKKGVLLKNFKIFIGYILYYTIAFIFSGGIFLLILLIIWKGCSKH